MKTKTIILIVLGVFVIAGSIGGYIMYNKGPVNVMNSKAIEATPDELYLSYTTDSVSSRGKYDDKVVKITGEVREIIESTGKQQVILLKTSSSGANINCTLEEPQLHLLKAGDQVTVKGIASGLGEAEPDLGILGDVYITRSIILNQ